MGVEMFLYLPLVAQCDIENPPTIDEDGARIATAIREYVAPEENDDDDGGGWRRRGGNDPQLKAMSGAHQNRPGWIDILAWSHGASSSYGRRGGGGSGHGNMQDLSMTKYSDTYSPLLTVMVMVGEVLPHALLRVCHKPENGAFKIIEFALKGVQVSSCSTGGSGGEDRLTENITITFQSIFIRHCKISVEDGKFVEDSRGSWDGEKKEGHREGLRTCLPLKALCKKLINEKIDLFDQKRLSSLPKAILEELDLSHLAVKNVVPLKGRQLLVTEEEVKESVRQNHFREVYIKQLNVEGLTSSIATLYKVAPSKIKAVYRILGNALVLVENNDQVWELSEQDQLSVSFDK